MAKKTAKSAKPGKPAAKRPAKKAIKKTAPSEPEVEARLIIGDHEAALHYRVTEKTIYNWRKDGMPAVALPGNRWQYDLDRTDPWVQARRDESETDSPEVIEAKRQQVIDKARKIRAEANISERKDELLEGNILDRAYYELFIAELILESRDAILRVPAFFHNHLCKKCQPKIAELRTQLETALTALARLKDGPDDENE